MCVEALCPGFRGVSGNALMRFFRGACVAAIFSSTPLYAQETTDKSDWSISLNGGSTIYSQGDDPPFASLSLTRDFDSGYVGVSVSMVDSGMVPGFVDAVPAKSEAVTFSAGKTLGDVSLDAYVSLGQRRFEAESFQRLGRTITIDSDGRSFATGGSLTYDLAVAENIFVSPFVAVDYDRIDIARAVLLGNGNLQSIESKEDGVTGTAGVGIQKLFGPEAQHAFGLSAAFVATSNSASARSGSASNLLSRVVAARNQPGQSDEWTEIGASASFAFASRWRLSFAVTRTLGFAGPEATSLSTGVSFAF